MLAYLLLMVFPIVLISAAVSDLATLTIPNRLSVFLVVGFVPLVVVAGLPFQSVLMHLLAGSAVLVAGFLLFLARTLGGGDAKLMAAASLWIGLEHLPIFFLYLVVIGGILAVTILLYRRLPAAATAMGPAWACRLHDKSTGIPYGIAISGAALLALPQTELYALVAG